MVFDNSFALRLGIQVILFLHWSLQNLVSGHTGGVLIDVMSQKKNGSSENFAASVIKEIRTEDGIMELEVPDVVCGAVLGPKAKTLVEIQQSTNCKVEVHKRGEGNVSAGCRLIRSCLSNFLYQQKKNFSV